MRPVVRAMLALPLAAVVGCTDHHAPGYTPEQYCADLAEAFCALNADCCSGVAFDLAGCTTAIEGSCADGDRELRGEGRVFRPDRARTCARGVDALYTECGELIRTDAEYVEAHLACDGVWAGTVPSGEPCTSSDECAPVEGEDVVCEPTGSGGSRCISRPYAMPGEPCGTRRGDCQVGYYCSSAGTCDRRRAVGEPCENGFQCASVSCDGGTCTADLLSCDWP